MTVVEKDDVRRFYDDFYNFLSSCGVDGVKIDVQCLLDALTSATVRQDLTNTYLDAWNIASLRNFNDKATSCMSLAPQIIFHSQLPHNRPRLPCRNSDDFIPGDPSAQPWHVWANAFNSILTRHLNVVPDWDMFQSAGPDAAFHAAARCISGGPVCISDVPGEHDVDLLAQVTARTIRGGVVVLRPSVPARAMDPYVSYGDGILLKVGGYNGPCLPRPLHFPSQLTELGSSRAGTPIFAVFNVSSTPITELLHLSAFPGAAGGPYVVASHVHRTVTAALDPDDPAALLTLTLGVRAFDVLTAFPLESVGGVEVANLGLRGKMTGAVVVASSVASETGKNRVFLDTSLKALGVLGKFASLLPLFFGCMQGTI